MKFQTFRFILYPAFALLCLGLGQSALAQQGLLPTGPVVTVDSQLSSEEETHPPLRLTPDKSEIVTVDEDVERVIIGSNIHLNILLDSPRRLIVVPRAPGATFFTLLGKNGKIIMQRHAIVASPKEQYVRVRHPCRGEGECMPIRVYYCPGLCHEVGIVGEGNATFSGSMPMQAENQNNSEDSDNNTTTESNNNSNSESENDNSSEER